MRKSTDNTSVPIEINGRRFPSISQCAKAFNVADATVVYHLNNGTLPHLGRSGRPKNNCHPITIAGEVYPSRTAAYRALGIGHQQFYRLLNAGKLLP